MLEEEEELERGSVHCPVHPQTAFLGLLCMADAVAEEINEINSVLPICMPELEEFMGSLWSYLKSENAFYEVTNFTEESL